VRAKALASSPAWGRGDWQRVVSGAGGGEARGGGGARVRDGDRGGRDNGWSFEEWRHGARGGCAAVAERMLDGTGSSNEKKGKEEKEGERRHQHVWSRKRLPNGVTNSYPNPHM